MYAPIKMFVETLHDYAQAMLDDNCAEAHRCADQIQRHADLIMIDPAFMKLYHDRHPGVDPKAALNTMAELLENLVEYCRRMTATRCDPISGCRS